MSWLFTLKTVFSAPAKIRKIAPGPIKVLNIINP